MNQYKNSLGKIFSSFIFLDCMLLILWIKETMLKVRLMIFIRISLRKLLDRSSIKYKLCLLAPIRRSFVKSFQNTIQPLFLMFWPIFTTPSWLLWHQSWYKPSRQEDNQGYKSHFIIRSVISAYKTRPHQTWREPQQKKNQT